MAGEVSNRVVRDLLASLRERGISLAPILDGLSIQEPSLLNPRDRIDWDDFARLSDRVMVALGGGLEAERFFAELISTRRQLRLLGTLVVGTWELYALSVRISRSLYRIVNARIERLPDGRYLFETSIPEPFRGSLGYAHGSLGAVRVYPRLIGLPDARVEAELGERRCRFWITAPAHETLAARAGALIAPLLDVLRQRDAIDASPADLQEALEILTEPSFGLPEQARLLGRELPAEDLAGVCARLGAVVEQRLNAARCELRLWHEGVLERVWGGAGEEAPQLQLPLHRGAEEVGRLCVACADALPEDARLLLEALVPWLEAALAPHLPPLEELRLRRLSPRYRRVAAPLALGLSDKEIAARTALSLRTVRTYVAAIHRELGVHSRGELVALLHRAGRDRSGPRAA
jgi:DNA-binding CsgD family transcriptional regulator